MKYNFNFYSFLFVVLILSFLNSCKKKSPTVIPSVTTDEVTKIWPTTASCGGNVTNEGDAAVSARGVCWSIAQSPTVSDNKTTDGTGEGIFTSNITGLTPETTYYIRAYAINQVGTVYGDQRVFITASIDPKITKQLIIAITTATAKLNGNIGYYDVSQIYRYGICWSKSNDPHPDINNGNSFEFIADSTSMNFSYKMTQLEFNTTYYARVYAEFKKSPTYYGDVISFTTIDNRGPAVTDIDGNVYHTVIIGSQTWMVENLKVSHYRNGDSISYVPDINKWPNITAGAYTHPVFSYGSLYNWYAVSDIRNIAPTGWHVPTDAEWNTLINFAGGSYSAGCALKETGFINWSIPNSRWSPNLTPATNEWGFTALPGGQIMNIEGVIKFAYAGLTGYWWSANVFDAVSATNYWMDFGYITAGNSTRNKWEGVSVRCVKD